SGCAMGDDWDIRAILGQKKEKGKIVYNVAWHTSWVDESDVSTNSETVFVDKLEIVGLTKESDQRKITQAKFVIENSNSKSKENKMEIWTYDKLKKNAPELLLEFYEDQLMKN
ncbi:hypothetical protein PMAYCL1PPCAC_28442, partial [Pristionchus mayeri]